MKEPFSSLSVDSRVDLMFLIVIPSLLFFFVISEAADLLQSLSIDQETMAKVTDNTGNNKVYLFIHLSLRVDFRF